MSGLIVLFLAALVGLGFAANFAAAWLHLDAHRLLLRSQESDAIHVMTRAGHFSWIAATCALAFLIVIAVAVAGPVPF
jgi:hypothetical protein